MSDRPQSSADMAAAETRIRDAMLATSPSLRLNAVMEAYWHTPESERDAFVAVLVARLTLVRPGPACADLPATVSPAGA